jgi:3-oxoacyl-[acyl-carrier protein] reductase
MDTNNVALVTGSSRGIGRSIAEKLLIDNYVVIVTSTNSNTIELFNDLIDKYQDRCFPFVLDISHKESIDNFFYSIKEFLPKISVLVNNAGITNDNLFIRMSEEEWFNVINTNLNGTFRITKPIIRSMLKNKFGRVVNISSIISSIGNPGQTNYSASKAAIDGFTRSLASEVASRNITVNSVAPGFIMSDMTESLNDDVKEKLLKSIPLGRMGKTSDVSDLVSFIISDAANYITGQTIHVNGGLFMS